MDAIYVYTFSDSHNAVRQANVKTMTSEAEMVSGQYYSIFKYRRSEIETLYCRHLEWLG